MRSSVIDKDILNFLIVFFIAGVIRQTSAAVIQGIKSTSLYNANDKLSILAGKNFSTNVYNSKTAWLVEFYASWCGHCQGYAKTYREIAIDTWAWQTVVRVGAINCYSDENDAVCNEQNIKAYPTLRLISPGAVFENKSEPVVLGASDAKSVEKELISKLSDLYITQKTWPHFKPTNRITLEELYARAPTTVKLVILIVERRDDYIGRQVMLDFSKYYQQLSIFRTTTDGKLWRTLHLSLPDIPALFVILPNRTAERIDLTQNTIGDIGKRNLFNYALRSYIHRTKLIDNFDDRDLEEIILSKKVLQNGDTKKLPDGDKNRIINQNTLSEKVYMVDLELALAYMLRREISRTKDIQGENYNALVRWLEVLVQYFPGREPVMNYLKQLLTNVKEQSKDLTGSKFRQMTDVTTDDAYLPKNNGEYRHCSGSSPKYRGYPCGVWLILHTLTVAQVQSASSETKDFSEVPRAVKGYIEHFFGCRVCSENFLKETKDITQLDSTYKYEAIIYLWKIHNHVNKRLHGDSTEDPTHPKIQFPSVEICSQCQSKKKSLIETIKQTESEFNLNNTIDFLMTFYSKKNIDMSSLQNLNILNVNDELSNDVTPLQLVVSNSMLELNDKSTQLTSIFGMLFSIVRRFPLYILICLLAFIAFIRFRYFRVKKKRYTL